jgi:hypothetical protein
LSDEGDGGGGDDGGFGICSSWTPGGVSSFESDHGLYSNTKTAPNSKDSLSSYDKATSALEASISASAGPASPNIAGSLTDYLGISGSAVTPVGGAELDLGFYSDGYGMIGAYFSLGPAMGIPGGSLALVSGHTQSLAGQSIGVSAGASYGIVGISKGFSFDPSTGDKTGEQWTAGLSVGPPIAASSAYTSTTTTEFTSLYLAYIQFLNWVGYPGNGSAGYPGYW